jgi:hypothetical protein
MLRKCSAPGCATLTLGALCLTHEPAPDRVFPRGRPYRLRNREVLVPFVPRTLRAEEEPAAGVVLLEGAG